jgi:hypothetical protein
MRPKDLLIRTATDVRKYGASHSGSVLKVPQQTVGGVGTPMWQAWTPGIAMGGVYLDPSHYNILHCYFTLWGDFIVWFARFFIIEYEGMEGTQMSFDKPGTPTFFSFGDGVFDHYVYPIQSLIVYTNKADSVFYVNYYDGTVAPTNYDPYNVEIELSGIGIIDPSFSMPSV